MHPLANTTVFGLASLDDVPILLAYHLNENVDLIESWTRDQTQLPRTPEEGNAWLHALTWHLIDYSDDLALRIRRRWTVRNITIQETDWLGDVHCFVFTRADSTELGRIYPSGPADMYWTFVELDEGHDPFLEAWEDGFGHPISPDGWTTDPSAGPPPDFAIYYDEG